MDVKFSTDASIIVQIIIGLLGIHGIRLKVPDRHAGLVDILKLETAVQIVELLFYVLFLRHLASSRVGDMAQVRYYDWFITTPTMLLTTIVFFSYQRAMQENTTPPRLSDFIRKHKDDIVYITICNALMLIFGFLGERGVISKASATVAGSAFLVLAFQRMYHGYAHSKASKQLFYIMFTVWAMYGVAYLFPDVQKNHAFNALDIFAKNFFGLYLYYKVRQVALV